MNSNFFPLPKISPIRICKNLMKILQWNLFSIAGLFVQLRHHSLTGNKKQAHFFCVISMTKIILFSKGDKLLRCHFSDYHLRMLEYL